MAQCSSSRLAAVALILCTGCLLAGVMDQSFVAAPWAARFPAAQLKALRSVACAASAVGLEGPKTSIVVFGDTGYIGRAALSICAGALLAVVGFAAKAHAASVDVYFGSGSFFRLQHEFVLKEALDLNRRAGDITAVTGYAGGTRVGDLDRVCYSSIAGAPDYEKLGHAQVVRLTLPPGRVADFARRFFDEALNRRNLEKGKRFRPLIGLRGGQKSRAFAAIEEGNGGRVKFVEGAGNDGDLDTGSVYVYDAKKFPFRPAEISCQFAPDPPNIFTKDYRELNDVQKALGGISNNGCPEIRLS